MLTADEIVMRIEELVDSGDEPNRIFQRVVVLLKQEREHYDWVGIYLLKGELLVLESFIGKPTEHTQIPVGAGICGAAVSQRKNLVVGDVTAVDNYLACSLETRAEIVVLIRNDDKIFGQIDIDSDQPDAFTSEDEVLLTRVAGRLTSLF